MNQSTENIGFLIVEVKTANGAIPLEGARVYVYPIEENDAIYSLRTNSSGRTERVALEAKNKMLSLTPGNDEPFINYNVTVTAQGYYSADKSRVPVFEGVTSILPFDLIPLSEGSSPESFEPDSLGRFTVTPNTDL
ncbi:MAG: carboxypeptidase regulatory-like domain-containing protein [Clostridia bacterium]|nr:carboxypeptidase regulatory-like domain-containing protein [Clostridia bacterium]